MILTTVILLKPDILQFPTPVHWLEQSGLQSEEKPLRHHPVLALNTYQVIMHCFFFVSQRDLKYFETANVTALTLSEVF